jgi:hypothetical protein
MKKLKTKTIYVLLENDKWTKESIPSEVMEEKVIQFLLNSKYGDQGWRTYKIRESTKSKINGKETTAH